MERCKNHNRIRQVILTHRAWLQRCAFYTMVYMKKIGAATILATMITGIFTTLGGWALARTNTNEIRINIIETKGTYSDKKLEDMHKDIKDMSKMLIQLRIRSNRRE